MDNPTPDAEADRYFAKAGTGSFHNIFPGVDIRTFAGERMMISHVTLEPGSVVVDHQHPHEQMGYLVSGTLEFTVGGVTRLLHAGDMWRIPGGVVHRVVAVDGPAVAIDIFTPIREDYL